MRAWSLLTAGALLSLAPPRFTAVQPDLLAAGARTS
jgi:hypothetical protein